MRLTISEAAKLSGVSVRTLRYYDQIGLLKPTEISENGYRYYGEEALAKLQQILFFRELEFPLSQIVELLEKVQSKSDILEKQRELLLLKRRRLTNLINLLDQTMKGECNMSFREFDMADIDEAKQKYAKEVKERWGSSKAYKESCKKTEKYQKSDWDRVTKEGEDIMASFAEILDSDPNGMEARTLVLKWKEYISRNYYECTEEILCGLGKMYVADERFTQNIDKHGTGTAKFMSKAIEAYCKRVHSM